MRGDSLAMTFGLRARAQSQGFLGPTDATKLSLPVYDMRTLPLDCGTKILRPRPVEDLQD